MNSYYQILRIIPERDIIGQPESSIIRKIESNYKSIITRISQLNIDTEKKNIMIAETEAARLTLSDKAKRDTYDEYIASIQSSTDQEPVSLEINLLTDDEINMIVNEINEENK